MKFYEDKIKGLKQQLKMTEIGFVEIVKQKAKQCADVDYAGAVRIAEELESGLSLIRDLNSQISFYEKKLEEV